MEDDKQSNFLVTAIVAIVGIVAIVALFFIMNSSEQQNMDLDDQNNLDEADQNNVGQAAGGISIKFGGGGKTKVKPWIKL